MNHHTGPQRAQPVGMGATRSGSLSRARRASAGRTSMSEPAVPVADHRGADDQSLPLYTPAQAAELLSIKESWLRRKAGRRAIPCTFIGRYLRFSAADLRAITEAGAQEIVRTFRCP